MGNPLHSVRKEWEKRRKSVEHQYLGDVNGDVTNSLHVDEARILTNVIKSCHYHSRFQNNVGTHWIYPPPRDTHCQDYYIFSVRNLYKSSFAMITGWGVEPSHTVNLLHPSTLRDLPMASRKIPRTEGNVPRWWEQAHNMRFGWWRNWHVIDNSHHIAFVSCTYL